MLDAYVTATVGALLLGSRLYPRGQDRPVPRGIEDVSGFTWPTVSIVIPARNEEMTLPVLLSSLERLDYPHYEIIVVDDRSEDETSAVVQRFAKVRLVNGASRPADWAGKPWACHQGALAATSDILLFTDADTSHRPDSLKRAVFTLKAREATLLSSLPYHRGKGWWEKLLGPFHMILLSMTAPYGEPKPRRVFAIGQYLMFDTQEYQALGGHTAIKTDLADDLALAQKVLTSGKTYHVYRGAPLFDVRMYDSLSAFIAGWRRNFRLGFRYGHPLSGLEATLIIMSLTGAGHLGTSWFTTLLCLLSLLFMCWRQRSLGCFSPLGVVLIPYSLTIFTLTAGLALWDLAFKRQLRWKGRDYTVSQSPR